MIKIRIQTPDGDDFSTAILAVPRIGETVTLAASRFSVLDVIHTLPDRYTEASILVILGGDSK